MKRWKSGKKKEAISTKSWAYRKKVYQIGREIDAEKNKIIRKKEREELTIEQDVKVRRYVRRKLEEYVEEGYSSKEAVDLIMQEKGIVEHFSYWVKNGIDIKQMLISWIKVPENSMKEEEKEIEQ